MNSDDRVALAHTQPGMRITSTGQAHRALAEEAQPGAPPLCAECLRGAAPQVDPGQGFRVSGLDALTPQGGPGHSRQGSRAGRGTPHNLSQASWAQHRAEHCAARSNAPGFRVQGQRTAQRLPHASVRRHISSQIWLLKRALDRWAMDRKAQSHGRESYAHKRALTSVLR
jgi:hypothetical protein